MSSVQLSKDQLSEDQLSFYHFDSCYSKHERDQRHKDVCNSTDFSTYCNNGGCINDLNICDGIANCEAAEDEDLVGCLKNGTFSPLATIQCNRKDVFNLNITIMAVKCDGTIECESGVDEENCSLPDQVSVDTFAIVVLFSILVAIIMWISTILNLKPITNVQTSLSKESFDELHDTSRIKSFMNLVQGGTYAKVINETFFRMEMDHHNGHYNETVCCIKNSLDSISLASVMKNSPFKKKSRLHRIKKVLFISTIEDVLNQEVILKMTMAAVSHIMDLFKDSLILIEICLSQGGPYLLMTQSAPFILGVRTTGLVC